jgi:heptosyltransferase-2
LNGNPRLDRIFPIPRAHWQALSKKKPLSEVLKEVRSFIEEIQFHRFDWLINLHNTYLSATIAHLVKAKRSTGFLMNEFGGTYFSQGWKATPSHLLKGEMNVSEAYMRGCGIEPENERLEIYLNEGEVDFGRGFLWKKGVRHGDLLIGINPGAGAPSRRWPPERFAKVGDHLIKGYGAKIIVFGGPKEEGLVREIGNFMESRPIEAYGLPIRHLASLIQRCNLFITNDTGPMHIAAAVGTPIVAIFGNTPSSNFPYRANCIGLQASLPCIPCLEPCKELKCIRAITIEEVMEAAKRMIQDGTTQEKAKSTL